MYILLQVGQLQKKVSFLEQSLLEQRQELNSTITSSYYKKYQVAKILEQTESFDWKGTINYLIDMYDRFQNLDQNDASVALQDFQVSIDHKISMR